MEEQTSWVTDIFQEPIGPGIKELPDTYPWRHFLQGINATALFRALLPVIRGAIFTGPVGNGRHTQAMALAYSLIEQNLEIPGDFEKAVLVQINPSVISPMLEDATLIERVDELYGTVTRLLQGPADTFAIVFDQIDLYPQSFMDRIAEHLLYQSSNKLFTVCVGESEARISRNLQRQLPHCRCLLPSSEKRKKYLSQIELIQVEDNWTDFSNPTTKNVAVQFENITMEEIVEKTEGCSYADLQDLLWLIKLGMSNFDMDEFKRTDNVVIHVQRADVLEAIELCKSTVDQRKPVQLVPMQQMPAVEYQASSMNQNAPANRKSDDEELSLDEKLKLIARTY